MKIESTLSIAILEDTSASKLQERIQNVIYKNKEHNYGTRIGNMTYGEDRHLRVIVETIECIDLEGKVTKTSDFV